MKRNAVLIIIAVSAVLMVGASTAQAELKMSDLVAQGYICAPASGNPNVFMTCTPFAGCTQTSYTCNGKPTYWCNKAGSCGQSGPKASR
jgi:hypothetical protein